MDLLNLLAFTFFVAISGCVGYTDNNNDYRLQNLVSLVPKESCSVERYAKRLTCVCKNTDTDVHFNFEIAYFTHNNLIQEVTLRQCRHVVVYLDYSQVDSTSYPFTFQEIQSVDIVGIQLEPNNKNRQELHIKLNNVQEFNMKGLVIDDTLKLKATNVKEVHIRNMTFAHVPSKGFEISQATVLDIQDSSFIRVSPMSVIVEKTKNVFVNNNEMTIDALQVVHATVGSQLVIRCNRILRRPVSPECSATTTVPTTTTTEMATTSALFHNAEAENGSNRRSTELLEEETDSGVSAGLIGGVVTGVLLVVVLVVVFMCVRKRTSAKHQKTDEKIVPTEINDDVEKQPAPESIPEEKESLLQKETDVMTSDENLEFEDTDLRPKFMSPIYIEEIQRNKIFNRQKSLLSEESFPVHNQAQPQLEHVRESEEKDTQDTPVTEASTDDSVEDSVSDTTQEDPVHLDKNSEPELEPEPVTLRKDSKTKVPENQQSLFQKFIAAATSNNDDPKDQPAENVQERSQRELESSPKRSSPSPSPAAEDVDLPPPEPHSPPPQRVANSND